MLASPHSRFPPADANRSSLTFTGGGFNSCRSSFGPASGTSTSTSSGGELARALDRLEAERHLARLIEEARQAQVNGVRPTRTFEQAAAKFVLENQHKRSTDDDVRLLKGLMPWIGSVPIDKVHMGTLQPWIADRRG